MPMDLSAERLRLITGSLTQGWTLQSYDGYDPNGIVAEPSGSLLRDNRGRLWINTDSSTGWQLWGGNSQIWTQTATGVEGTDLPATLPIPFGGSDYQAFVTNFTGSYSPAFKVVNKTTTGFTVVSTAPFGAGDKIDLMAVTGGLGVSIDGQAFTNFSGSFNAAIANLSGTLNAAFQAFTGSYTTGSVAIITNDNGVASVNLTTEGTLDWVAQMAGTALLQQTAPQSKIGPGWLINGVRWVFGGQSLSADTPGAGGISLTATSGDTTGAAALSANANRGRINGSTSTSVVGYGIQVTVPASPDEDRVLTHHYGHFGNTVTCTAWLTDGTAPVTATNVLAANAGNFGRFAIRFRAGSIPCSFVAKFIVTTIAAGTSSTSYSHHATTLSGTFI